jgi:hypothetical protein
MVGVEHPSDDGYCMTHHHHHIIYFIIGKNLIWFRQLGGCISALLPAGAPTVLTMQEDWVIDSGH